MKHTKKQIEFDAAGQSLGRLSVKIADALRSKDTPHYLPNSEPSVHVTVINADKLSLAPKRLEQKIYYSHSGYPGGLTEKSMDTLFNEDSREVVRKAVYGMLPKNKLRDKLMTNLVIYRGSK